MIRRLFYLPDAWRSTEIFWDNMLLLVDILGGPGPPPTLIWTCTLIY